MSLFDKNIIFTLEELEALNALYAEWEPLSQAAWDKAKADMENGNYLDMPIGEYFNRFEENIDRIRYLSQQISNIKTPAEERYFKKFEGELDELKALCFHLINEITMEDIENVIDNSYKDYKESGKLNYTIYELVIFRSCDLQLAAFYYFKNKNEYTLKEYDALIKKLHKAAVDKLQSLFPGIDIKAELDKENVLRKSFIGKKKNEHNNIIKNVTKPKSYTALNSAISNQYFTMQESLLRINSDGQYTFLPEATYEINVGRKAEPVTTIVSLSYEGELTGKLSNLKGYDNTLLNAVCSLLEAGNKTFTVSDIYRTMTGNSKKDPQPKQKEMIRNSLLKLSQTRITIDRSEELVRGVYKYEGETITKAKISDTLLSFFEGEFITETGRKINAFTIKNEPPLLLYAKAKKQLVSFPTSLLYFENVSATEDSIPIAEYIVKQVVMYSKGHRNNTIILFDTICQATTAKAPKDKVEAKRFRDTVYKILDELIKNPAIEPYGLKGYEEKKEGRTIEGVKLKFKK